MESLFCREKGVKLTQDDAFGPFISGMQCFLFKPFISKYLYTHTKFTQRGPLHHQPAPPLGNISRGKTATSLHHENWGLDARECS